MPTLLPSDSCSCDAIIGTDSDTDDDMRNWLVLKPSVIIDIRLWLKAPSPAPSATGLRAVGHALRQVVAQRHLHAGAGRRAQHQRLERPALVLRLQQLEHGDVALNALLPGAALSVDLAAGVRSATKTIALGSLTPTRSL